ncbi:MAG: RHS repeat-associated core domain-containing protein, partial [bacterium]
REGWITKTRTSVAGGVTKDTVYDYDTGGRLRKVTYASGDNYAFYLWYDYDSAGRLHKIYHNTTNSKPGTSSAEYAYNARGQITQEKLGGTVQTVDFTYNTRGLLTKINDPASLGSDRFAMQIGYDAKVSGGPSTGWSAEKNGNLSQIKWINRKFDDNALYYTFDYNSRDFLTTANNSDDNYDVTYGFDDNGNLTSLNRGTAWTYNYDGDEANTNRVDDITNLTSHNNWDYNLNGHQTKDTNGSFSSATFWFPGAAFHDITMSGGTLEMRYDKNNQRVQKKVAGGTTTNYMRDIRGLVLAVFNSTTISERYVWGPLGIVAIVKGNNSSPTTYYTIKDHLGAVRTVVNTGGTAVAGYDYYPYGLNLRSSVNAGASCRFLFGGKELDTELSLDLYYFEARFMNPEVSRFTSPDAARSGPGPYSFSAGNPLKYVDPNGLSPSPARECVGCNLEDRAIYGTLRAYSGFGEVGAQLMGTSQFGGEIPCSGCPVSNPSSGRVASEVSDNDPEDPYLKALKKAIRYEECLNRAAEWHHDCYIRADSGAPGLHPVARGANRLMCDVVYETREAICTVKFIS